jgi:uncharacterized protein YciI
LPLFALHCLDKPGTESLRQATRPAHLAFVQSRADYRFGAYLKDEAGVMRGSLMAVEVPDFAAARAFSAADPYVQADLFERVEIHEWPVGIDAAPQARISAP